MGWSSYLLGSRQVCTDHLEHVHRILNHGTEFVFHCFVRIPFFSINMATVTLDNVSKRFDTTLAVDQVSLQISDGELLVLLGPSGCGKSTILRMIAGLEEITAGTISIAGEPVNEVAPRDRDIAMVFQNYALYPHMTVGKNLEFPLKMRRLGQQEVQQRVQDAAEMLGISELLERKPSQLSGGQQQRVALGRAMVRDPAVFLLDEPLSNLDMQLRGVMRQEILDLHARLGSTMIHVTHDQQEAMVLGDRIAILNNGRLQQLATPLEIYQQPANRFVASFIGSPAINLLPVDGPLQQQLAGLMQLPEEKLELGFRPERMMIGDQGDLSLSCQVVASQQLGAESILTLQTMDQQVLMRTSQPQSCAIGSELTTSVSLADLQLFSAASGDRLEQAIT
jgi:multiple sugar transport system ATP-binding protein